jgi:hypothetical protein
MVPRARRGVKILGTIVLVTGVWLLAFAIGTGITALATPWEEFQQGVE